MHIEIKGTHVPAIGIGTWEVPPEPAYEAVAHALSLGYRHVDTAQAYGNEAACGKAVADAAVPRDQVWVTTKVWMANAAPEEVRSSTEESLRELGTDYVDLLLIHWPVPDVPIADTLGAMVELMEQGKTRHVGVSNYTPSQAREAARVAPILTNQVEYHPLLDQSELLAEAAADGHRLTAYSPLANGRAVPQHPVLAEIGAGHGKTAAQVALRWLLQQDVIVLPRSTNPERRAENFDVTDFTLTPEEMARISELGSKEGRVIDPPFAPAWDT